MAITVTDRTPSARRSTPRISPHINTATIMTMADLQDCWTWLDTFFRDKATEAAKAAGFNEGAFPENYRRIKREVAEVGSPIEHFLNRGVSHRDYIAHNVIRSVNEIKNQVQGKEFNGEWWVEKIEFWKSRRLVHHDADRTQADSEARAALHGLSTVGYASVEQVNLTDAGMSMTTRDTSEKKSYEVDVFGIVVTLVDRRNASDVRREKGEVVSATDLARDQGLAQTATMLGTAVERLGVTLSNALPGAGSSDEPAPHHKTAAKMTRLEQESKDALAIAATVRREKDELQAKLEAMERQLAALKK